MIVKTNIFVKKFTKSLACQNGYVSLYILKTISNVQVDISSRASSWGFLLPLWI
ncbi:hypothetical protein [Borreliella burgdorferi]|uniref:hypothetical protein n=1 Tax=Borreliella burgdorferi TaxID=139 RepID=UPI00030646DF|nr:hypothetical protein [Borreliella burgdorferi]